MSKRKNPTKAEISAVMAALGRRNKGVPKRRTAAGDAQRRKAARQPRPRATPATTRRTAGAGGGGRASAIQMKVRKGVKVDFTGLPENPFDPASWQ